MYTEANNQIRLWAAGRNWNDDLETSKHLSEASGNGGMELPQDLSEGMPYAEGMIARTADTAGGLVAAQSFEVE